MVGCEADGQRVRPRRVGVSFRGRFLPPALPCYTAVMSPRRTYRGGGPWRTALRRLHAMGLTDAEIAAALWDLSDGAIRALETHCGQRWSQKALEAVAEAGVGDADWYRRLVCYHRSRLDLPANRYEQPWHNRRAHLIRYAQVRGWGYLSGWKEKAERLFNLHVPEQEIAKRMHWPAEVLSAWKREPWDVLRKREVDALSALAERGPLPRREIAPGRTGDGTWTGLLQRKALVRREPGRWLFTLAPGIHPDVRGENMTPTGVELLMQTLGLTLDSTDAVYSPREHHCRLSDEEDADLAG